MMNKRFIKASEEYCSFKNHVPAPYLRKSFELDFVPEKASISICGLGFYLLYINGREITKGELAPYINNPDKYCYYDTYDIEKLLNRGENVIGIVLGNGFFNPFGGAVWEFDKADWLGAPRVALEFCAEADDKKVEFIADESFKVSASPIIFDELRMGEHYDANLEQTGWNDIGFDDSSWKNAIKAETPRGDLRSCKAHSIRAIKELEPVEIFKCKNGYIYDFGENCAGVCTLKINAEKGQKIIMEHGENLVDGELSVTGIYYGKVKGHEYYNDYFQKDIYIAKGEGEEVYTPRFVYHGFRYVSVSGITEAQATKELLRYKVLSSDFKTVADFSCSDETINTLFEMVKRTDRSNFIYFPTDCPHREKNGWTGDASISAERIATMYDVGDSWHEWMANVRATQTPSGCISIIVPTDKWGLDWCSPAWDMALFNIPYMLFKLRGDLEIVKENAQAMLAYLSYIIKERTSNGTITRGFGDWVPVGKTNPEDFASPVALTSSIMVMDMTKKSAEMFEAVGYNHQALFAKGIYVDMRETIRRELIDFETMTAKGECQTSQAMCIDYDVFDECEKPAAFERLVQFVHEKNDCMDCGFLGMHSLFHVLSEFGESDLAYEMITRKEYPSYAHLIELGETTIWEWFQPDDVFNTSRNHPAFADIGRWFINCLGGLTIVGADEVKIRPNFVKKLEFASASCELRSGTVNVSWRRENNKIKLDIFIPQGVKCNIDLPKGYDIETNFVYEDK